VAIAGPGGRGWIPVAIAAALTGGSALLTRLWLPNAYAAAVGVAVGVVSGVWVARGVAALQAGDELRKIQCQEPSRCRWRKR
jgi:hypothetical protein